MAKNVFVTYTLWLIGGFFGLHHLYLGRDKHAFVWWSTFGGFFGCGWFRDLFHIPRYVDDANHEPTYMEDLHLKMFRSKKPSSSWARFLGQFSVGLLYGLIFIGAVPDPSEFGDDDTIGFKIAQLVKKICYVLLPAATAYGVYFVGDIGREKASFKVAVVGSYIAIPLYGGFGAENIQAMSMFSVIALNWKGKSWRTPLKRKKGLCKRFYKFTIWVLVYSSLWSSMLYYNASMTTKDDEVVKLRDAVKNFFTSPAWQDTKETLGRLWEHYNKQGWNKIWEEMVETLDPIGEGNAYKVLHVTTHSTQEEITASYRKLARRWHPDKVKGEKEKLIAQEKFMEIQKAYEILSNRFSKKKFKQRRPVFTEHDEF